MPLLRSLCALLSFTALLSPLTSAQATGNFGPHALTAADRERIDTIVSRMTVAEKLDYIGGTGFAVRAVPSVKLPEFKMSDATAGVRSNTGFPSTTYAAGIGLAATWDRDLAARVGTGVGRDSRSRGIYYLLGPGVNIYRSPRNGRNFEYLGEDPFLALTIAVGYIEGLQSEGVSATIKHYAANNSEFLRHDSDSIVDQQALHEIYLPTFEAAVKDGHTGAVMDSYNLINGEHATQNTYLNKDVLRKQFGFEGTLMSDWDATYDAVGAANGGLDLEMPNGKFMNRANLEAALREGKITQPTIDEKIRHILTTAMEFGWLDRPQVDNAIASNDAANNRVALESARESAVLLKNDGDLLPLDRNQVKTLLVVGPDAYPGVAVGGGSAAVVPFHAISPLEGLVNYAGDHGLKVLYDRGLPIVSDLARSTNYTTPEGGRGLKLETFANSDSFAGTPTVTTAPHLIESGTAIMTLVDNPDLLADAIANGVRSKIESRRWTGIFTAPSDGEYIVVLEGSGEGSGNRATLDGKMIIDNWDLFRAFQSSLVMPLTAGPHNLVVEDKQTGHGFGGQTRFAIVPAATIVSQRARELAALADVVIVAAGFDHSNESEGGDRTFNLPFGQDQLIAAMAAANKKVVVALTSGGNVDSQAWIDRIPAFLETWYGGQAAGTALAEILFGDVNPSGHLPVTFERRAEDNPTYNSYYPDPGTRKVVYKESIFVGYRGYQHNQVKPLFPFGFGLSYTRFEFSNLQVSPSTGGTNPAVRVEFDLKNKGTRKGADVAQVYVSSDDEPLPHAPRELKAFQRVELQAGETRHITAQLDARAFAHYDATQSKWTVHPGKFTVHLGDSIDTVLDGNVVIGR